MGEDRLVKRGRAAARRARLRAQTSASLQAELRETARTVELLQKINRSLAADFDLGTLVQIVTDAGTELAGAQFGAFFYNVLDEQGETLMLYALSGAPREAFAGYPMPRNTRIFHPTFSGQGIVRVDDVQADPRYGHNPPYYGMPQGHLPVRSYLSVPVVARSGDVIGGLFFGHEAVGVFTEKSEQLIVGIADQAAIAIENARLYHSARAEVGQRRDAEARLKELNDTLEERVEERTAALQHTNERLMIEISERRRVEAQLRVSEARSRSLMADVIDQIAVGIVVLDSDFSVAWVNESMTRFTGIPREELIGRPQAQVLEDRLRHMVADPEAFAGHLRRSYERNDCSEAFECHILPAEARRERWLVHWGKPIAEGIYEGGRVEMYTDITDLRQAYHALGHTNAELAARNRELQEFAYVVSHDLQEPLRKIHAFAELLHAEHAGDLTEEALGFLDRIQNASERMSRLISDLLAFARVATQPVPRVDVDLNTVVSEVIADLEARIQDTGGRVDVRPLPVLQADETQMRQLLQNLIGNGLKFHRHGEVPVVCVRAEATGPSEEDRIERVRLIVEDNGIGFSAEHAERIFAPFHRLHAGAQYSGSGIGLAICRRIAERHHGSIRAYSRPGLGARFAVELPVRQPHHSEIA